MGFLCYLLQLGLLGANIWTVLIYLIPNIFPVLKRCYHDSSRINFPHAVERAQLVTILTLGETVIAIISTYPLTESLYQGALLFAGMSFLFISYMTQTFLAIDHHRQTAGSLMFYAHIPIFIGINIFTVGIEFLADSHHANLGFALFLFSFLSFYAGVLTTTHYNQSIYQLHLKTYLKIGLLLGIVLLSCSLLDIISYYCRSFFVRQHGHIIVIIWQFVEENVSIIIFHILTQGKIYVIFHKRYLTNKTFTAQPENRKLN
ncbi:low temperature requirement protein A [Streptococcus macedonicus]|uniref:Low temperature requirement protein A n=1 Tax=Streptococcus macedonicus TaxID=59310 RepID=A0AA47FE10_STRMC|nr:low temperature requirement protein A [Streptococcus macedonicus]MCW8485427.1 low temperature requirement protein A [Streptococcus macedonicus]MCW8501093.1 low temperature requirement protein A [Streptococcus macedonicus]MCW8502945.1 low temperature requirement protein A [Streptococcus macedonicus]MCW8505014.1 low temperature requirement protein A [Streptococcus macedonicus]MCW8512199.1 low temperature requirement protein A [Streptococcus macedonicus]